MACRSFLLGLLGVGLAVGCTEEPDVVAYALTVEGGVDDAATLRDAAQDHFCDPSQRFERARLPEQLVLDLYVMDCKIPLSSFMPRHGSSSQISATDFSRLIRAPQLEAAPGTTAAVLCDPVRGGYFLEPWDKPQRLVLCPATCELVKTEVASLLATDGCDTPADDDAGHP